MYANNQDVPLEFDFAVKIYHSILDKERVSPSVVWELAEYVDQTSNSILYSLDDKIIQDTTNVRKQHNLSQAIAVINNNSINSVALTVPAPSSP